MRIHYQPIGIIHSPFKKVPGTPIQSTFSKDGEGTVELLPQFKQGLKDLKGFSHIILIYHLHKSRGYDLLCRPFLDEVKRGVFATRAPRRPNPIGLSIVRLKKIRNTTLSVAALDVLDKTPLIDIKPYIPQFDALTSPQVGWFEKALKKKKHRTRADNRFADKE
jgi:tRNA-Thr(GGU) m(6)t(6)A37 methyltransferase TsaA